MATMICFTPDRQVVCARSFSDVATVWTTGAAAVAHIPTCGNLGAFAGARKRPAQHLAEALT